MSRPKSLILAQARRRKDSGGAAIFIVAVTLSMLASMGVYGLSAAAADVQAAGHLRQAVQSQHADEGALMAAAESFTPATAGQLVHDMVDPNTRSNKTLSGATRCKSARPPTTDTSTLNAEACLTLTEPQMIALAAKVNTWLTPNVYASDSFGSVAQKPFFRVEVTNPIEIPGPAGNSIEGQQGSQMFFAQLTATVYVDMKTSTTAVADSTMLGRGRFTVGPYRR